MWFICTTATPAYSRISKTEMSAECPWGRCLLVQFYPWHCHRTSSRCFQKELRLRCTASVWFAPSFSSVKNSGASFRILWQCGAKTGSCPQRTFLACPRGMPDRLACRSLSRNLSEWFCLVRLEGRRTSDKLTCRVFGCSRNSHRNCPPWLTQRHQMSKNWCSFSCKTLPCPRDRIEAYWPIISLWRRYYKRLARIQSLDRGSMLAASSCDSDTSSKEQAK